MEYDRENQNLCGKNKNPLPIIVRADRRNEHFVRTEIYHDRQNDSGAVKSEKPMRWIRRALFWLFGQKQYVLL
jgi:hypothetical protein